MKKQTTSSIAQKTQTAERETNRTVQKIAPCLWFDDQAEEAAKFYVSLFPNSRILNVSRYGKSAAKGSGRPAGSVMTVTFRLDGQDFMGLNGGPAFSFSPAISLIVNCDTQDELDEIWEKLSADPSAEQCGWLKDKYGVSWQIVPTGLGEMIADSKSGNPDKVMEALLPMKKLDIQTLRAAYRKR